MSAGYFFLCLNLFFIAAALRFLWRSFRILQTGQYVISNWLFGKKQINYHVTVSGFMAKFEAIKYLVIEVVLISSLLVEIFYNLKGEFKGIQFQTFFVIAVIDLPVEIIQAVLIRRDWAKRRKGKEDLIY